MAADNVIKVWDLRNHRCIQTIADVDWPSQEDAHPSAMMYDPARCAVLLPSHTYNKTTLDLGKTGLQRTCGWIKSALAKQRRVLSDERCMQPAQSSC